MSSSTTFLLKVPLMYLQLLVIISTAGQIISDDDDGLTTTSSICGRNTVTDGVGPRISAPQTGGEVVAGRGSWPWMASLGRCVLTTCVGGRTIVTSDNYVCDLKQL